MATLLHLEQRAHPDWDNLERFEGVVAFSFVLPFLLPLEPQAIPIGVDDEYLRIRGVTPRVGPRLDADAAQLLDDLVGD